MTYSRHNALFSTALSSLEASISVCLVLLYGGLFSKLGIISKDGEKNSELVNGEEGRQSVDDITSSVAPRNDRFAARALVHRK